MPEQPALHEGRLVMRAPYMRRRTANHATDAHLGITEQLRVRGKGLPTDKSGGRGDFFVTINVVLPDRVSDAERELWEKLRATSTFNPRA